MYSIAVIFRVTVAGALALIYGPRQTRLTSIANKLARTIRHLIAIINVEKPTRDGRSLESRANESGSKGRMRI